MNCEQKFEFKTVQVYKLKNFFEKDTPKTAIFGR